MAQAEAEPIEFEMNGDDRQILIRALDRGKRFLGSVGMREEQARAQRAREAVASADGGSVVPLHKEDAVRAVAALATLRQHLLDEDEVAEAAAVEETIRTLTEQHPFLERILEEAA